MERVQILILGFAYGVKDSVMKERLGEEHIIWKDKKVLKVKIKSYEYDIGSRGDNVIALE